MIRPLLLATLLLSLAACSKDNEEDSNETDTDTDTDADTDADADADTDADTEPVQLDAVMVSQSACHAAGKPLLNATDVGGGDIEVSHANFRTMTTCGDFEVRAMLDTAENRIMIQLRDLNKPCKGECYLDFVYRVLDLAPGDYIVLAPGGQAPVTVE